MFEIDQDTKQITVIKKDTVLLQLAFNKYYLTQGDKVTFTVAKEKESENPDIQVVITDFVNGAARINLSSEDTDLNKGTYYYDIQVDTSSGRVDTVVGPAKFKIVEGVTY